MKLKTVLSACAICFCSIVSATTFDTNLGNFNPLAGSWSYKSHGATESFDDVYTFNALTALTLDLNVHGDWEQLVV